MSVPFARMTGTVTSDGLGRWFVRCEGRCYFFNNIIDHNPYRGIGSNGAYFLLAKGKFGDPEMTLANQNMKPIDPSVYSSNSQCESVRWLSGIEQNTWIVGNTGAHFSAGEVVDFYGIGKNELVGNAEPYVFWMDAGGCKAPAPLGVDILPPEDVFVAVEVRRALSMENRIKKIEGDAATAATTPHSDQSPFVGRIAALARTLLKERDVARAQVEQLQKSQSDSKKRSRGDDTEAFAGKESGCFHSLLIDSDGEPIVYRSLA